MVVAKNSTFNLQYGSYYKIYRYKYPKYRLDDRAYFYTYFSYFNFCSFHNAVELATMLFEVFNSIFISSLTVDFSIALSISFS